jgi:hypothetical protein
MGPAPKNRNAIENLLLILLLSRVVLAFYVAKIEIHEAFWLQLF